MTEEQFSVCIKQIINHDQSGLRAIYDAYLSYIYQIVLGIVGRREDAEDVTSDFFIKLWQKADTFRDGHGHKGYLATIARNMAIDYLRKMRREVLDSFSEEADDDTPKTEIAAPDNTEETVISDISLNEALNTLKEKERKVVDMKILSEMTFNEISEALQMPMGTVTWLYREAIKKLRRCGYEES